jgi:alpha-beta hydrolase superfamily lysophospholipase
VVLLVSLACLLVAGCASPAVAPEPPTFTPPPETENVGIVLAEDGITLRAHLFGAENDVGVILSHMRPNDQTAWFGFAEQLADAGYAALTFDFRGYGESDGEEDFAALDDDLLAAVEYLRDTRGKRTIFLVGASMGATTSLVVAAEVEFAGVVAVSPPAEFEELSAVEALPQVTEPVLVVASEEDAPSLELEMLLERAGANVTEELYTGNAHGTDLFLGEHAGAVSERVLAFLDEHSGN